MRGLALAIIAAALSLGADMKQAAGGKSSADRFTALMFILAAMVFVGFGW
jgi:hypothetical protein